VPLEGVVHALRRIRAALEPGGVAIDTQPVSPDPLVAAAGSPLGQADMREWLRTIQAVDALVACSVDAGLFSIEGERRFVVTDSWDSGPECAETIAGWQGTRLPDALAKRIVAASPPLTVDQEVRLRVLRAR
jgi:hypothetical protein